MSSSSSSSAASVSATATFDLPNALGNVRNAAGVARATGDQNKIADSLISLQDQIDELLLALKSKIKVTVTANAISDDSTRRQRISGAYPWATKDTPTPIASGELYRHPNFGIHEKILKDVNGGTKPQFILDGRGVVNNFSQTTQAPTISLTTSPTGGSLPGGFTYTVGVWAVGSDGLWTDMAVMTIDVPTDTNTNTIGVTVAFADPANDTGWVAITPIPQAGWYGPNAQAIAVGGTAYTFDTIGDLNTPVPDGLFDHYVAQARTGFKLGTWGMEIDVVAGAVLTFSDAAFSVNQFAGRTLGILHKKDFTQRLPLGDVTIVSNTATTVTVSEDLSARGVVAGDEAFSYMKATTHTATTIGDSKCVNAAAGGQATSGMPVDAYKGQLVLIIRGTGAGTTPKLIVANSSTVLTVATPFDVTPDATSEFVIISSTVDVEVSTGRIEFTSTTADDGVELTIPIPNVWNSYFVQVLTSTASGERSLVQYSPFRLIFHNGPQTGLVSTDLGDPLERWVVGFLPGGLPGDVPIGPPPGTSELFIVENDCTPFAWKALAEVGPVGADLIFDILVFKGSSAGVSIFGSGTKIVIPDGTADRTIVVELTLTDPVDLDAGDRLQLSVVQVGSTTPGQRAKVELFARKKVQTAGAQ